MIIVVRDGMTEEMTEVIMIAEVVTGQMAATDSVER